MQCQMGQSAEPGTLDRVKTEMETILCRALSRRGVSGIGEDLITVEYDYRGTKLIANPTAVCRRLLRQANLVEEVDHVDGK